MHRQALLLRSFCTLKQKIRIKISSFTSIAREVLYQQDLLFMIRCSTSNVMCRQHVSEWLQAWEHFFLQVEQKRFALPNAEIMIHQPLGGAQGQATEIQIAAEHILKTRRKLNEILAERTGKSYEQVCADTERDNFMSADEAAEYGLIDKVVVNR